MSFTTDIKKERGKVYAADTRLKKSSLIGYSTGVIYCFFFFTKEFVKLFDKI